MMSARTSFTKKSATTLFNRNFETVSSHDVVTDMLSLIVAAMRIFRPGLDPGRGNIPKNLGWVNVGCNHGTASRKEENQ